MSNEYKDCERDKITEEKEIVEKIYQQCVEDIKVFYKENKFAYEAQILGEELDEFLKERINH